MSVGRILKHWVMSPIPVTMAFPQSSLDAVSRCIEECETQTSAEFRLIIERSIPSKDLRRNITAARIVKQSDLDGIVKRIEESFSKGQFESGVCDAFRELTKLLAPAFPNKPVENPVPNDPVIL